MACPVRVYPLRKPKNHRLPVPRYTLTLPDGVDHVYTSYIGVQQHSDDPASADAKRTVCESIKTWLQSAHQPASYESFCLIDGHEAPGTTVWVCYWTDARTHESALAALDLRALHALLPKHHQPAIGLWLEAFATPVARLETNYAGPDYLPGLARLPGSRAAEHELATYWGAARDRIPDSAHDLFPRPAAAERPQDPVGRGQYLAGTSHANLVHIRSGQWWAACGAAEAAAYETKLEPTLRKGLRYLNEHAADTGAMGLRYLRNTDINSALVDDERRETCGAGFFANLEDLETWAKTHGSHLAIWRGALAHYKAFPDNRRFRTWHEVSVVEQGRARFEYVNCTRGTGVMGTTHLKVEELDL